MTSNESEPSPKSSDLPHDEDWGEDWGHENEVAQPTTPAPKDESESIPVLPRRGSVADPDRPKRRAGPRVKINEIDREVSERPKRMRPDVDRLSRMDTSFEQGPAQPADIEDRQWGEPTSFNPKWVILVSVTIIALVIACLIILQRRTAGGETPARTDPAGQKTAAVLVLEQLLEREQEARKMYADFASAQVVEEILPMLRKGSQLRELVRRTGHQRLVDKTWRPKETARWTPQVLRGRPFACLTGELPDFTPFRAYFVIEDGALLLDWKATTTYSTADFSDLSQGRGDGAEVRGIMRHARLYTAGWEEQDYLSYQLESPDKRHILWCYVKRGSDEARLLGLFFDENEIVADEDKQVPMTVQLKRGPEGSLPNQWEVEAIHHEEWIKFE